MSIWSVQTGEIVGSINGPRPDLDSYPENRADHFSITPDHKTLVAGARLGGRLIIYNLSDWSPRATAQIPNCLISSVAAETNTNLALIGCSAGVASILDMSSGVIRNQLQAYEATPFGDIAITAICKNPNGSDVFVSGSVLLIYGPYVKDTSAINYLKSIDSARIIDSKNSNKIASLPAKTIVAPVTAAAWDPRGRYVAFVDGGGTLFIWQPNEGSGALQRIALRKPNVSLAISRDGARIAVTAGTGVSIYTVE